MLEGSIPDSLVVDIGEWIVNCCPFKQENLFPAVYDYSTSNDSVSLVSFFRLVMGLIDKGLSMYFANPQCIIDQCFYVLLVGYIVKSRFLGVFSLEQT